MDFLKALNLIKDGGKITREAWLKADFAYLATNGAGYNDVIYSDAGEPLILSLSDVVANDWKIVKEL